jgi:YjbE family integral membrane protein
MVILVNTVLSGDNAIVIAMATKDLEGDHKKKAVIWGTLGAIILRIIFIVILILKIPFIMIAGGILLFYVAITLLIHSDGDSNVKAGENILQAIKTIIIADTAMSLDNVLALTATAKGNYTIVIIGILVSIPMIVFFSQMISKLMSKFPILIYIGSGILAWTASEMMLEDKNITKFITNLNSSHIVIQIISVILVLGIGYIVNKMHQKHKI